MTSKIKRREWDSRRYSTPREAYILAIYPYVKELQAQNIDVKASGVNASAVVDPRFTTRGERGNVYAGRVRWYAGLWYIEAVVVSTSVVLNVMK